VRRDNTYALIHAKTKEVSISTVYDIRPTFQRGGKVFVATRIDNDSGHRPRSFHHVSNQIKRGDPEVELFIRGPRICAPEDTRDSDAVPPGSELRR